MKRAAVFLDRDGVLNRAIVRDGKPFPLQRLEEFDILHGVETALASLRSAGFLLVVVTNQPDVAKGTQRRELVDAMHGRLLAKLPLDAIKVCWCLEGPDCGCYKPKSGLLLDAAQEFSIDLSASFMVGDRWRDVGAGRAAGCCTIFVDRGYAEPLIDQPDYTCCDLSEATGVILARHRGSH